MDGSPRSWWSPLPVVAAVVGLLVACDRNGGEQPVATASVSSPFPPKTATTAASPGRSSSAPAGPDGGRDGSAAEATDQPPVAPITSQAELIELVLAGLPPKRRSLDDEQTTFLRRAVGPGSFGSMNQGNPEIAKHEIARAACLADLEGLTLQSPAQRAQCKGYPNMVPIYADGDPESAEACIDLFEFPNQPCELPFVWSSATQANRVCRALGKRLCTQQEWVTACSADPDGGEPSNYAYGDELDLEACNTNRSKRDDQDELCDPTSVQSTWKTCGTHTAPAGAFRRCRSRLGVFDLHGNVAEAMTRYDRKEERTVSQLKGSAFFYVDVHRRLDEKPAKQTYPDHCAHDPRWHVQPMTKAWHVNYHLGFRCCLDVE